MLFALGSLSILATQCRSMTQTDVADFAHASFCQTASAISYSDKDTEETKGEILIHNCRGHALCGWPAAEEVCKQTDGGFGTAGFGTGMAAP